MKEDIPKWRFRVLVAIAVALLIVKVLAAIQRHEAAELARTKELAQSIFANGSTYDVYFFRKRNYYYVIEKDSKVVFDSRDWGEMRGCPQQLLVRGNEVYRSCYLLPEERVVSELLP